MGEFIPLMAMIVSLGALSIDAMLPALLPIASDLGAADPNDAQLVVSTMFLGFAMGQLIYGPLSDSVGRKRAIYMGITLFLLGCVLSVGATTFTWMLVGRVFQGVGAASTRIVTMALAGVLPARGDGVACGWGCAEGPRCRLRPRSTLDLPSFFCRFGEWTNLWQLAGRGKRCVCRGE